MHVYNWQHIVGLAINTSEGINLKPYFLFVFVISISGCSGCPFMLR